VSVWICCTWLLTRRRGLAEIAPWDYEDCESALAGRSSRLSRRSPERVEGRRRNELRDFLRRVDDRLNRVSRNAFREFDFIVPEGHDEISPAFQRWVCGSKPSSPGGTKGNGVSGLDFCRPSGTGLSSPLNPALKRWAMVGCPYGTDFRQKSRKALVLAGAQTPIARVPRAGEQAVGICNLKSPICNQAKRSVCLSYVVVRWTAATRRQSQERIYHEANKRRCMTRTRFKRGSGKG